MPDIIPLEMNFAYWRQKAQQAQRTGNLREAARLYRAALRQHDSNALRRELAQVYADMRCMAASDRLYHENLAHDAGDADSLFGLARNCSLKGDGRGMSALLDQYLRMAPCGEQADQARDILWQQPRDPKPAPRTCRAETLFNQAADVQDDKELMAIFTRTYGSGEKRDSWKRTRREWSAPASGGGSRSAGKEKQPPRQYLLVDGYNMIYAWKELSELAQVNLDAARMALADILANYRGYRKMTLILVFDAYKVEGGTEHVQEYSGIHMVFTKEAETADAYIERAVKNTAAVRNADITVATSDAAEQMIIWGEGARRMSARELREEIEVARSEIRSGYLDRAGREGKRYLFAGLDEQLRNDLEKLRLGKS